MCLLGNEQPRRSVVPLTERRMGEIGTDSFQQKQVSQKLVTIVQVALVSQGGLQNCPRLCGPVSTCMNLSDVVLLSCP